MTSLDEIKAAVQKLNRTEVEALLQWLDEHLEDRLDLNDDLKVKLETSKQEIRAGAFSIRQSK